MDGFGQSKLTSVLSVFASGSALVGWA